MRVKWIIKEFIYYYIYLQVLCSDLKKQIDYLLFCNYKYIFCNNVTSLTCGCSNSPLKNIFIHYNRWTFNYIRTFNYKINNSKIKIIFFKILYMIIYIIFFQIIIQWLMTKYMDTLEKECKCLVDYKRVYILLYLCVIFLIMLYRISKLISYLFSCMKYRNMFCK